MVAGGLQRVRCLFRSLAYIMEIKDIVKVIVCCFNGLL